MGVWTTIVPWVTGDVITASRFNTQYGDNLNFVHESYLKETFRGLQLKRDPGALNVARLVKADSIIMDDGTRLDNWAMQFALNSSTGAGGIDTGSVTNNSWYEIYAIAKEDGTRNLLLHLAPVISVAGTGGSSTVAHSALRDASARTLLAQGVQVAVTTAGIVGVDLVLSRVGTVSGIVYAELRTDSSGDPSSTILGTTEAVDAAAISLASAGSTVVRLIFRTPVSMTSGTQYHLVIQGTYTINASNYIQVGGDTSNSSANGVAKANNGSTWSTGGVGASILDFTLNLWKVTSTSVTMPTGYTKKCLIGYAYHTTGNVFTDFVAHDRVVTTPYGSIASAVTVTFETQATIPSLVPPVPVLMNASMSGSASGQEGFLGGAPGGLGDIGGVSQKAYGATVSGTSILGMDRRIVVEQQSVYYRRTVGAGNVNFFSSGYQW